ncbi:helix-hairpin-helix domain-containing protein [Gottfriedia acidiceleris]|uniref:helix-hairpin-helix domain-containing protein n=1 Tax=Bacillaceae TaxID=186817 RepID=UPI000BEC2211|nr:MULTISPECIES: helix-hairpin-helix domain-containing protein [unclassified Bacillus (in: firmicutes)]PEC48509.1 competence protein ComEA [Bacillus sp. AFS096315]PFM81061.1 competence protein ComEA [Bacillus sp. AFS077874]
MKKLIHNKLVWLGLVIVGILVVNFYQTERKNEVVFAKQSIEEEIVKKKDDQKKEVSMPVNSKVFMVDVKGAIQKPGVIQCNEGERVFDVIRLAGGFKEKADVNKVNLAEKIVDEMVIYVPFNGEETDQTIITNRGDETKQNEMIDINHASQSDLEKIPGVGPAKAKNILEYIDQNGPFTSVEQLESVNGIGKKSLEKMTPYIVIR